MFLSREFFLVHSKLFLFAWVITLSFLNGSDSFGVSNFVGKAYKKVASGVSEAASYVPDPQEPLTYVPRLIGETKSNIENSFVSQSPEDVKFYLYEDKLNPEAFTEIKIGDPESVFEHTTFNHKKPLKILIHGFQQNFQSRFPQNTKDAYLDHTDYNVICIDWGALSTPRAGQIASVLYPFVVENVPRVGERVADFIVYLRANDFIATLGLIHIIGFSLGAHVAAVAGNSVKRRMGGYTVGRITGSSYYSVKGLDAAGPKFLTAHRERRLDQDDASFVDVIHTSQLGYATQIGHADFFPNGGIKQPLCVDPDFSVVQTISSLGNAITGTCSHTRATDYFTKSIKEHIYACKCNSWVDFKVSCRSSCPTMVPFGEDCPITARGKYYLDLSP